MLFYTLVIFLLCIFGGESLVPASCGVADCSHHCREVLGTPTCYCPDDMTLGPDKKTCQAPVSILMAMFRSISVLREGTDDVESVVPVRATAFDYNYAKKEIFAFSNNTILRYAFKNHLRHPTAPVTVATTDTLVTSLAVDWIHEEVYWICQQRGAVEVAQAVGGGHRTVITHTNVEGEEDTSPDWHDLAVEPFVGKLFWLGSEGLHSASLTGKNLQTNLASWAPRLKLEDLTLDTDNQLIYVIGSPGASSDKVVARCGYDGSQVEELFTVHQPGSRVYGFGLVDEKLFWQTTYEGETLYSCQIPKKGQKPNITLIHEVNQVVKDMKIYHPYLQKPAK